MEAKRQQFANRIQSYSREALLSLCLELYARAEDAELCLRSLRESDTAMARDYQAAQAKIRELKAKNRELQTGYDRVCGQNALLLQKVYGSHNEKLDTVHASSGEDPQDPLSEEMIPEEISDTESKTEAKPTGGKPKAAGSTTKNGGQEETPDQEARKKARKIIAEALGSSEKSHSPTKMDTSRLPHTDTFILNPEEMDRRFGKENWEIASWHHKKLLHRPLVNSYVEHRYTAVIRNRSTGELLSLPMEGGVFKGSCVTASFLASEIYEKVFKSVPGYRQSAALEHQGLVIPRQDLSNWLIRASEERFSVAWDYMKRLQCGRRYGQCDETFLLVLHVPGKKPTAKHYVWTHSTSELDEGPPIVLYVYEPTRHTDHLRRYYADFSGWLVSDAYISYEILCRESNGKIYLCGCLMHCRRRFAEALKLIRLDQLTAEQIEALPAYRILCKIGEIYQEERIWKKASSEERLQNRQEKEKKLVEELYALIESVDLEDPLTSEKLKDAVNYSLNHKEELCRFLENGRIPCDNGFCERSIRMLARGRHAWLFANTERGARALMTAYSMVETAIMNHANPLLYLKYLLEKVPAYLDLPCNSERLEELMPWSEVYREYERSELEKEIQAFVPRSQKKPFYRPYQIRELTDDKPDEAAS